MVEDKSNLTVKTENVVSRVELSTVGESIKYDGVKVWHYSRAAAVDGDAFEEALDSIEEGADSVTMNGGAVKIERYGDTTVPDDPEAPFAVDFVYPDAGQRRVTYLRHPSKADLRDLLASFDE